jgi:hypothetical protein
MLIGDESEIQTGSESESKTPIGIHIESNA